MTRDEAEKEICNAAEGGLRWVSAEAAQALLAELRLWDKHSCYREGA